MDCSHPKPQPLAGNSAFALDLYAQLREEPGNLCLSPFSILVALAMTWAGARGETASQMASGLHFDLPPQAAHRAIRSLLERLDEIQRKGQVQLKTANSIWPQAGYGFLPEYLELLETSYWASLTLLDYNDPETARQTINAWVEGQTAGKITDLIQPGVINPLTRLALVNAVYFKGDWATPFDDQMTRPETFHAASRPVQAAMMRRTDNFHYLETEELQVLELPYAGGDLSMLVLLPRAPDGLPRLERQVTPATLETWGARLPVRSVSVCIPKFKVTASFMLNNALVGLGMRDAFDAYRADFSGMDGRRWLFIAAALHKAFLEVNEQGSEAAAASAVLMQARSLPPPPVVFRADHPFLFLIRERASGNILFLGRVNEPA